MDGAIFLSASVPDPLRAAEYARTADTVSITAAVSALVYVALGRRVLVWGGHPAITPMIAVIAEDMGVDYGKWVRLYQTRYFKDEYPEDNSKFQNVVFTANVAKDRDKSLLRMRSEMFKKNRFSAAVFIGGMGGIIDEYNLFRKFQPKANLIPVVSTGGAAMRVAELQDRDDEDLRNDFDYISLMHRHLRISVKERRYRLPEEQPLAVADRFG